MPVARAMRAAAANQIMMLAVNPLSSVCTNVHRDQYCTTRIELLVILSFTHFYGRAAAELSFSDLVLRTFTGLMKTVIVGKFVRSTAVWDETTRPAHFHNIATHKTLASCTTCHPQ